MDIKFLILENNIIIQDRIIFSQNLSMIYIQKECDPICKTCVCYDEVARQRKKLFNDAAAKHLVLMLDHWQRIPPITPQARGATRAIAPSPL